MISLHKDTPSKSSKGRRSVIAPLAQLVSTKGIVKTRALEPGVVPVTTRLMEDAVTRFNSQRRLAVALPHWQKDDDEVYCRQKCEYMDIICGADETVGVGQVVLFMNVESVLVKGKLNLEATHIRLATILARYGMMDERIEAVPAKKTFLAIRPGCLESQSN